MPLVLVVLLGSVAAGRLAGGRVARLARIDLRGTWLVFVAVALQLGLGLMTALGGPVGTLGRPLLAASHVAVLAFIFGNRRQPGMWLVFLGLALNATVMLANGAMPVSGDALAALGGERAVDPGKHELLTGSTLLPALADTMPVPVLRSVVSVGDLVLAAGVAVLVVRRMRDPAAPAQRDPDALSPSRPRDEDAG